MNSGSSAATMLTEPLRVFLTVKSVIFAPTTPSVHDQVRIGRGRPLRRHHLCLVHATQFGVHV